MRFRPSLLVALVSSLGLALVPSGAGAATLNKAACDTSFDLPGAVCSTLTVPIDRSGKVPGTVTLFFDRLPAKKKSKSTIVVFPGGPGVATTILGLDVLPVVRGSLDDHDVLLLDQRGTGRSDYLDCDQDLNAVTDFLVGDISRTLG